MRAWFCNGPIIADVGSCPAGRFRDSLPSGALFDEVDDGFDMDFC